MSKSTSNKSNHILLSSSFLLLIFVTNKPANPLTCVELRQLLCRRNPRYSPQYQLVHQLCLFDPLADSPSCLKCIFSVLEKYKCDFAHSNVEQMRHCASASCHVTSCQFLLKCLQSQTCIGVKKRICPVKLCYLHKAGYILMGDKY